MDNGQQHTLTADDARSYMVTTYGKNMFNLWLARYRCAQKALDMALVATSSEPEYRRAVKASDWPEVLP